MKAKISSLIAALLSISILTSTIITTFFLNNQPAYAALIEFKSGWNDVDNSDVGNYRTEDQAKDFLKQRTNDSTVKAATGSPLCYIQVTKGCHQINSPHFTLSGSLPPGRQYKKYNECKVSDWVGTNSYHSECF